MMLADFTSMLGCRVRLRDFVHEGVDCCELILSMPPEDGRSFVSVLLSEDDLTTIVRSIRERDER